MQTISFSPERLREARELNGLSQARAARAADVARATIQNAEAGRFTPQADALARMAQVYGVTLDSLFVHEQNPPTPSEECEEDVNTQARVAVSGKSSATRAR